MKDLVIAGYALHCAASLTMFSVWCLGYLGYFGASIQATASRCVPIAVYVGTCAIAAASAVALIFHPL